MDGESSGTTGGLACLESDLPPPFCHLYSPFAPEQTTSIAGIYPDEFNGARPVLLLDDTADLFAAVDPRDIESIVFQGVIPSDLQPMTTRVVAGDLTDDGVADLVIYPSDSAASAFVVDGTTMSEIAVLEIEPDVFRRYFGFIDFDGDAKLELVAADDRMSGLTSTITSWNFSDGTFTEVFSFDTGVPFRPANWSDRILIADVTGDGSDDFTYAWNSDAEPYLDGAGVAREITTIVAPSLSTDDPLVVRSSQHVWAAQVNVGDMDADGDAELLLGETPDAISILDWDSDGFHVVGTLSLPDEYEPGAFGTLLPGRLTVGGGGAFIGGIKLKDSGPLDSFTAALFVEGILPHIVEQRGRLVADLNLDGLDDFYADNGFYLSVTQ